ncbi:acyltransferase [Mucilaginibacter rubeus]|uniref:Acyltransferase n=1 Tax=Mucilaginibacter rubeus TaxID=2027860 RepID=A0AAE6JD76_9SPHI|nr:MULTISPECIES: acyltransferase [Mucilaginibacter]QEM03448.1 acyltransferase [Mucilaginibacter rubeus]QEM16063.1 acyltransferase [Mucilaginibacter gossypii]QTE41182.1 acyltransferase [Mucilaginibacter rubeus]QTE47786.1 acyltransferase [Mucilaginibacter rubeus]QTE59177.1 acyltransferase [Mucilaginibacter rubeus]
MLAELIKSLKKYKHKLYLRSIDTFIEKGNSHLLENFRIILNQPRHNKIYTKVGNDTVLDCTIIFESETGEVSIGDRSFIGASTIICKSKIEFGDEVFVAWGSYFYDHDSHSVDYRERENDIKTQLEDYRAGRNFIENKNWTVVNTKPIKICSNAWIGMNCTILKGVTIGEGAIVGAGSVVTKDVTPWTIVGGNPAKVIKEIPTDLRKS